MDMKEKIATLEEEIKYKRIVNDILMLKKKKVLEKEKLEDIDDYDVVYASTDPEENYKGYRLLKKKGEEVIYALISLVDLNTKNYQVYSADYTNEEDVKYLIDLAKLKDDAGGKTGIEEMLVAFGVIIITLSTLAAVFAMFSDLLIGLGILLGGVPIGLILIALSKMLVLLKEIRNKLD